MTSGDAREECDGRNNRYSGIARAERHFSRGCADVANEIQIIKIQKIWSKADLIRAIGVFAAKNGLSSAFD
jgi:hypothetical protein